MKTLWQDVRYGARVLWKSKGFTAVAVVTLALGVGANSAIFSVVNAVLLRPLPLEEPDRLVTPWGNNERPDESQVVSYPDFADWRERTQTLSNITAYNRSGALLKVGDEQEALSGTSASADIFPMLGIKPPLGRAYTREEDKPGAPPVILISQGVWQRHFNSDPSVVGRQMTLGNRPYEIIGVLPEGFKFPVQATKMDFMQPLAPALGDRVQRRGSYSLRAVARLKPGVTPEQAAAEMRQIGADIERQFPDEGLRLGLRLVTLHEALVGDVRFALLVLLGAVGLVLLIACVNVANLSLARSASRRREMAVRTALGASRGRVVRQLLTESLLLSLLGGAAGLLLAMWGTDLLIAASPVDIPRLKEVGLDARVVGFTTAVSVLTGVLFGLAPALQVSRAQLADSLKEGARGSTEGGGRVRARSLLVVAEVALSLVLLAGAGLLLRSFERVRAVDPGFDPQNVLTVGLSAARSKYQTGEQQAAFFGDVVRRVSESPGVVSAGLTSMLPLSGDNSAGTFLIDGRPAPAASEKPKANYRVVSPDYFRTMGIALKSGRAVTEHDTNDAPRVIVINEALARRYFSGEDPLGRRIRIETDPQLEPNPPAREVVGVVADVRHESLEAPAEPEYYLPYRQAPERYMEVVARMAPGVGAEALRAAVKAVDREQYVPEVAPMSKLLSESVARRRFQMLLLGLFAAAALVLAAVGIYGVMSYAVTQRTHEIGVRLALGAEGGDVLRMVVGQGLGLALAGVGVGLLAALVLARAISGLLYGISPADPVTFASVSLLLVAVALFACVVPARRATRVDPMIALRHE
ncbi:MAG TPA: ABC transporter permease [Pyrinomonadaceae bacterium]|jgi:putative ABC transport system permease protein|nr:ABC transporter permease [Pyrinomonadaceae bacterium]